MALTLKLFTILKNALDKKKEPMIIFHSATEKTSMLWKRAITLSSLNQAGKNSMVGHLGIRFTRFTEETLEAIMPVDHRTKQPFGLLHGGASVVLAESLGSLAGYLCTEAEQRVVGIEINANHIKAVRNGHVRGVCKALHLGRRSQVWQIEIFDEQDRLCCISRLTTAVLES